MEAKGGWRRVNRTVAPDLVKSGDPSEIETLKDPRSSRALLLPVHQSEGTGLTFYSLGALAMDGSDRMKNARLLLVEDDRDSLELLAVILGERYSVSGCGSAAEALAVLEAITPDVLVLDIGMAPVDGLQCLEAIRAMRGHSRTPAIALTGFARDDERQAFLAAGFQAVVTKPILDYRQLETLIDTLLKSACSVAAPSSDTNPWSKESSVSRGVLTGSLDDGMISGRGRSRT
jgi:CheY-like chemotaxis protein